MVEIEGSLNRSVVNGATFTIGDESGDVINVAVGSATATDKAAPVVVMKTVEDLNSDGFFDAMKITFSEAVDDSTIFANDFQTADASLAERDPILAIIGRRPPPVRVSLHETVKVDVVFEVPEGLRPDEISYGGGFLTDTAVYKFR